MSHKEEIMIRTRELFEKMKNSSGDAQINYRNQIVSLNIPLVTTVLKKYKPYTDDQFQVGCLGLIKAADTYEMMREVPFHNYACFVIEREIHMEFRRYKESIEGQLGDGMISLDESTVLENGDEVDTYNMIEDTEATRYMEEFIEDNQLEFLCDSIIKPSIRDVADKGRTSNSKINLDVWEVLEFRYIMALVFEESQKRRFNLAQMARECGVSQPNLHNRHMRVMDNIFQRMWSHMAISFEELRQRLRGDKAVPRRLLCLDPGKTTGWCVFQDGVLQSWGQVEDCYDDNNINIQGFMDLFQAADPDFILYEDYRVYGNKLDRHTYSPVMTVRLIGAIETYCQMNGIPSHKQMATTAKNFCTDQKLQNWGFWQEGMRHARDAIRHGCYFLLFYKKGEDIL